MLYNKYTVLNVNPFLQPSYRCVGDINHVDGHTEPND